MRFLPLFALTAALVVPMVAPHALEAVAQQPYWQNAGKNLTASLKVDAMGTRVVHLSETITQIIDCNSQGKLWDGAGCVPPGGSSLNISCPDGTVLKGISNGNPVCVAAPAGTNGVDGKDAAVPVCTADQVVVVKDSKLACADGSSVISTTVPMGTTCGLAITGSSGGGHISTLTSIAKCQGQAVASLRRSGAFYGLVFTCPSGYVGVETPNFLREAFIYSTHDSNALSLGSFLTCAKE